MLLVGWGEGGFWIFIALQCDLPFLSINNKSKASSMLIIVVLSDLALVSTVVLVFHLLAKINITTSTSLNV
jgi:hypothetical protein